MIDPQMFGMTPEQMEAAKQVGQYVGARFVVDRSRHRFSLEFAPRVSQADLAAAGIDPGNLVEQWVQALGTQLHNYLGIEGEVEDVE